MLTGIRRRGAKMGRLGGLTGNLGTSQKEHQEEEGEVKELGRTPPSCFETPQPSQPVFWLFPELTVNPSKFLILEVGISRCFSSVSMIVDVCSSWAWHGQFG